MRQELIFKNIEFLNVIDLEIHSKDGTYINEKKNRVKSRFRYLS